MDMNTSIAQLSMGMSANKLQQGIGVSLMKKAMDTNAQAVENLLGMMDNSSSGAVAFAGDVGAMFDARA